MNIILGTLTETAVAVMGVYGRLQSFIFMPVFGLNQGVLPIMGFNYGARNRKRSLHLDATKTLTGRDWNDEDSVRTSQQREEYLKQYTEAGYDRFADYLNE